MKITKNTVDIKQIIHDFYSYYAIKLQLSQGGIIYGAINGHRDEQHISRT